MKFYALLLQTSVLATAMFGVSANPALADEAIIIGGGYSLQSSQGQIELNVQYARDTLTDKGLKVTTFFTDGGAPGNDVFIQHQAPLDTTFEPLSRVFGDHLEQNREYRDNQIDGLAGSTKREELLPALNNLLSTANEPIWMIYNGHGNQGKSNSDQVTLELWDKTRITAKELRTELKASKQPIRYAFTQCYSGGFHALAYEESGKSLKPATPQRCGFTAVSPFSLAEGCSASINTGDYRDYTTHFFAALSGYERDGSIIVSEPDTNEDGQVSPREAHMYTLLNANSTDISWSTSEDFLDRWEPWYLKWTPGIKDLPSNEYAKLFRELATLAEVSLKENSVRTIRDELSALQSERAVMSNAYYETAQKVKKTQQVIAEEIIAQWPEILGPYTKAYQTLAANGTLEEISTNIKAHEAYPSLLDNQNTLLAMETAQLTVDRKAIQLQKLLHVRRIATLKQRLLEFGSETDINTYNGFVQCEEQPMTNATGAASAQAANE